MSGRHASLRSMLEGYPESGDPNPTLQDLARINEPLSIGLRDEAEDSCRVLLPGDSLVGHIFPTAADPVPYLDVPFSQLKAQIGDSETNPQERQKMQRALQLQKDFHRCGIEMVRAPDYSLPEGFEFQTSDKESGIRRADPFSR